MGKANVISIGRLAKASNCSVPTIRYYEEIGLLPPANRNEGQQRVYGDVDLGRLNFIRRCRDFGFPIERIKEMLDLVATPERDCVAARELARTQLDVVRHKLKELRALEKSLKQFVDDCNSLCAGGPVSDCVILSDLSQPAACNTAALTKRTCCRS